MGNTKRILIVALLTTALAVPMIVQAQSAAFYVTTIEPETERHGTQDPPTWEAMEFTPIPGDDPDRYPPGGYIQGFTSKVRAPSHTPPANEGEWNAARYVWSPRSMVVTEGTEVTLEFYGVVGSVHRTQLFHGRLETLGQRPGPAGLSPLSDCEISDNSDADDNVIDEARCLFNVNRFELTEVTFNAGQPGTILVHCHTHGPSMNAYITVLPNEAD